VRGGPDRDRDRSRIVTAVRPEGDLDVLDWTDRVLDLHVGAVAHGGHCVARVPVDDGRERVVFVRHALPGERVHAVVTDDRGGAFCRADAIAVLEPAPGRVEPPYVCRVPALRSGITHPVDDVLIVTHERCGRGHPCGCRQPVRTCVPGPASFGLEVVARLIRRVVVIELRKRGNAEGMASRRPQLDAGRGPHAGIDRRVPRRPSRTARPTTSPPAARTSTARPTASTSPTSNARGTST